ncbi:MAG: sugar phosphate isomerase/epimerase [Bryobacterales bacterium]|nr:sugar phosphate isomerase/epimerase [Bryobacterales bacterium]
MANFPVAVITDEFTQDFEKICQTTRELEIPGLEVRTAWDKNIVDMTDEQVLEIKRLAEKYGRTICGVASPVFKCTHPEGGDIDHRFEQDAFHAAHTFDDQPRILARAIEICKMLDAPILRVFSFWRTVEPTKLHDQIVASLHTALDAARPAGVKIGIENEHACNLATGGEVAPVLEAIPDPNLGIVWDPANSYVAGAVAFPDDYDKIPKGRILHVHAKDGVMDLAADRMQWGDVGAGNVNWKGQMAALVRDGYDGLVSLETHWGGPGGDKFAGSTICAKSLKRLVAEA